MELVAIWLFTTVLQSQYHYDSIL